MRKMSYYPNVKSNILALLFTLALGFICYTQFQINDLKERVSYLDLEITSSSCVDEEDFSELKIEFDVFKKYTNKEFENTWVSLGRVRDNFIALGTGQYLDERKRGLAIKN